MTSNSASVEQVVKEGLDIVVLREPATGSIAEIIPGIGNNLIRFESGDHPVIEPPARMQKLQQEAFAPFQYGMPILFPPNRVHKGRFSYRGREYGLPINEPPDFHLHGELCKRAWEIVEKGVSGDGGAYVTSRFSYASHPDLMAYFPHSLAFTVTYRLLAGRLYLEGAIVNDGEEESPLAFGLHPYFSLPFHRGRDIILHAPALEEWPVTSQAMVKGLPSQTEFSRSLNEGVSISEYSELGCSLVTLREGGATCRIDVPDNAYSILFRLGPEFPYLVLFRPDWSSAYSLEPYTYVTDAFNLPYESERTGARGLMPGETFRFATSMWTEALD
ncbi:aldose 1-epimerase [Paenibacillus doosanensis]|uniref:aldose 1-epimerase n=1 Tax=Paenibacillus doosanensis TaxID=1229154 RepID=UPI00217F8810|nr:aldose 1-epimerase [Paenibacillus doosanensis]MCS7460926.1 aldose 1-epimerase [Paenibacillus doosanensis]